MPADSPPRILLCIPQLVGGGAERQIRLLMPRLVEHGMKVALFSRFAGNDAASLEASGIACHPIRTSGNHDPRLLVELARAARRSRAGIIHTWLTQMDVIGGAVALATGRKWVLSERNSPGAYPGGAKDVARQSLGRYADAVVANSPAGLAVWPDHPRRSVIANGLDFDGIQGTAGAPDAVRSGGGALIAAVARLVKEKRLEAVLGAFAALRRTRPDARLAIVGDGPEEGRLKARAAELGVAGDIVFTGFRADAWSWIRAASVCVSASRFEGHPNSVLEAAAAGTPQVLSDIVMHRDAVGNGGALFVDPADGDAFAAAIAALIERPPLARSIAREARTTVASLTPDRAADLYAALYRRTASRCPPLGAGRAAPWSSTA